MKAHLHFVISAAVVAGEVATRDWSTVDVPDLLTLNAASAATAGSTADGGAPNESTFAPTCGTVDTAERVVREAAPGGAAGAAAQTTTTAAAAAVAAAVALPPRPPRPDNWATMSRKQRQNWKLRAGKRRHLDGGDAAPRSDDSYTEDESSARVDTKKPRVPSACSGQGEASDGLSSASAIENKAERGATEAAASRVMGLEGCDAGLRAAAVDETVHKSGAATSEAPSALAAPPPGLASALRERRERERERQRQRQERQRDQNGGR